jgi:hypothetical protein
VLDHELRKAVPHNDLETSHHVASSQRHSYSPEEKAAHLRRGASNYTQAHFDDLENTNECPVSNMQVDMYWAHPNLYAVHAQPLTFPRTT